MDRPGDVFPFSADHADLDDENDRWLDDGEIEGLVSVVDGELILHDIATKDTSLAGTRSGAGRRCLQALRPKFDRILASGVIHPFSGEDDNGPLLFWCSMLREGLIDGMVLLNCGVEITKQDVGIPVETSFGALTVLPEGGFLHRPTDAFRP